MDNIFSQIMVAGRYKDFLPSDMIAAIGLRDCFGAHQSKISAALWFRQVHCASPVTGDHGWKVGGFLRLGAMR